MSSSREKGILEDSISSIEGGMIVKQFILMVKWDMMQELLLIALLLLRTLVWPQQFSSSFSMTELDL